MNNTSPCRSRWIHPAHIALLMILILAAYFRSAGLFRGLGEGAIFHPDSPKQVAMLRNYLHGHHVVYYDSWFYDGYPYGLNRLDELIIRSARAIGEPIRSWTHPHLPTPQPPLHLDLFFWGRVLRVLYGLLTVGLLYAIVRRFGGSRFSGLIAALLYAVAPLGSTVTHSVTGDIGLDLFLPAAIWCIAGYVYSGKTRWFLLFGFFCGFAFSCKYQGALALWIPASFALFSVLVNRRLFLSMLGNGLAVLPGFLAGAAVGIPPLLVNPKTTWQDMRINFRNIQGYNAPEGYFEQPLNQRLWYGLSTNLPFVLRCLGWGLTILCVAALAWAVLRLWKERTESQAQILRSNAMRMAIVSFPFVALMLSTALKPHIQGFHFSFLAPVMALCAALILDDVFIRRPGLLLRSLAALVAASALTESICAMQKETYFWKQDEIRNYGTTFTQQVFKSPPPVSADLDVGNVLKHFYAEPAEMPVFRNRPSVVVSPHAKWWLAAHQLPVPCVPWPVAQSWMFVNGPVFPVSDRMFAVPSSGPGSLYRECTCCERPPLAVITGGACGWAIERALVFDQPSETLRLGLRTGRWPARYEFKTGGNWHSGFLLPQSQSIIELPARPAYAFPAQNHRPGAYIFDFKARAQLGPVWVTVLNDPREIALFEFSGPDPKSLPDNLLSDLSEVELSGILQRLRYIEGGRRTPAEDGSFTLCDHMPPLAAGTYMLTAEVHNPGAAQSLEFTLKDYSDDSRRRAWHTAILKQGTQNVSWKFAKSFTPYDGEIVLTTDAEGVVIERWEIKPDLDGESFSRPVVEAEDNPIKPLDIGIHFPGIGTLERLYFPETLAGGEPFLHSTQWTLDEKIRHSTFHEAMVFIHLRNEEGQRVASFDYLLRAASLATNRMVWREDLLPPDLPPGTYYIEGGLFSHFSRKRYPFTPRDTIVHNRNRRSIRLATITVR